MIQICSSKINHQLLYQEITLIFFFCVIVGYYQPAGPLISPHLLPPPQSIEGDQTQQTQSANGMTGENVDPDVMITGNNFQYNGFVMCNCDFISLS